jgi:hypothetical protein
MAALAGLLHLSSFLKHTHMAYHLVRKSYEATHEQGAKIYLEHVFDLLEGR